MFTYLPNVDFGQLMTTSCDKLPGPAKKPQRVFTSDSVSPTVTETSRSRCDTSKIIGQIAGLDFFFKV